MTMRRVVALAAGVALLVSACGGDDAPAEGTATDTATTDTATSDATATDMTATGAGTGTAAAGDADLAAFCEALVQAEMTSSRGPDVDFEAATDEEIQAALGKFSQELEPLLDAMTASVPAEVTDEVATLDRLLRQALETGDGSIFESDEFRSADLAVDEFVVDRCDYASVGVRAVDYAFEQVPATAESGIVAFDFANAGTEVHEMAVFRIHDGVTETVEELLQLPEDEAGSKVTFVGGSFAMPDTNDITFVELEPGSYGVACFVPVGTTPEAMEQTGTGSGGSEGPPHFTQGMFADFTVEG